MKKALIVCIVLGIFGAKLFAMNENVVVWEQIYQQMDTDQQRLSVMLKIMDLKDREFTPLLVKALEKLVAAQIESGPVTEVYAKNQLARLIVQELGNLKSLESDELVFSVYDETTEPVLKGEAAVALGKMRADRYAERLALDLSAINLGPSPSISRNQEIIALGLVQSLDLMRSPLGYESVFMASFGWYSSVSRVKDTAKSALQTMVDDPTDSILKILINNPSLDIKQAALEAAFASNAPKDKKALVASQALQIGIARATDEVAVTAAVGKLRSSAMAGLINLEDKTPANVPMFIEVIKMDKKNDATLDQTLKAYMALGYNGSDDAAKYLGTKLSGYNLMEKVKGNTTRDKSLIRQIINSMALTKNPMVKNYLVQSQFIDYDANILRLLDTALASFPK